MKEKVKEIAFGLSLLLGAIASTVVLIKACQYGDKEDPQKFIEKCKKSGGQVLINSDGSIGCIQNEDRP